MTTISTVKAIVLADIKSVTRIVEQLNTQTPHPWSHRTSCYLTEDYKTAIKSSLWQWPKKDFIFTFTFCWAQETNWEKKRKRIWYDVSNTKQKLKCIDNARIRKKKSIRIKFTNGNVTDNSWTKGQQQAFIIDVQECLLWLPRKQPAPRRRPSKNARFLSDGDAIEFVQTIRDCRFNANLLDVASSRKCHLTTRPCAAIHQSGSDNLRAGSRYWREGWRDSAD